MAAANCCGCCLSHPEVEVKQATSQSHLGEYVYQVHPNLRKRTQLKFSDPAQIDPVDVLFLALPHGQAQKQIDAMPRWQGRSSTFRLISDYGARPITRSGMVRRTPRRSG